MHSPPPSANKRQLKANISSSVCRHHTQNNTLKQKLDILLLSSKTQINDLKSYYVDQLNTFQNERNMLLRSLSNKNVLIKKSLP